MPPNTTSSSEDRYAKQILLEEIGQEGQTILSRAHVLIAGLGGLGSSVAEILCRMGVGGLRLVDRDYVDFTNLHRQTVYTEEDADHVAPKAVALKDRLSRVNAEVRIEARVTHIDPSNVTRLVKGVDLVVDGSDNLDLRLLLNEMCVKVGKPFVFGAVHGTAGMTMGILPGESACLRCLLAEQEVGFPPSSRAGIYPPTVRIVASLQAALVVQALLRGRSGKDWAGQLHVIDAWTMEFDRVHVARRKERNPCPVCVKREFEYLRAERPAGPQVVVEGDTVIILPERRASVDLAVLRARLQRVEPVKVNEHLLWARIGDVEMAVFRDGRMSVRGAGDWAEAVHLYERYLGE
ncbi:MAG: ThiF family adenylyltransferase [candidate division KSB1 bacterium]|nr:ThiF family adenylyltransferase [candidate division KSB1 bacterium]